jgi:hypothetical protein
MTICRRPLNIVVVVLQTPLSKAWHHEWPVEPKREIDCACSINTAEISEDDPFVDVQAAFEEQICATFELLPQANGAGAKVVRTCPVEPLEMVACPASSLASDLQRR